MSRIKDKSDIDEFVDVIASGYEWVCLSCNHFNNEIEITEEVKCGGCRQTFKTNPPEHAYEN